MTPPPSGPPKVRRSRSYVGVHRNHNHPNNNPQGNTQYPAKNQPSIRRKKKRKLLDPTGTEVPEHHQSPSREPISITEATTTTTTTTTTHGVSRLEAMKASSVPDLSALSVEPSTGRDDTSRRRHRHSCKARAPRQNHSATHHTHHRQRKSAEPSRRSSSRAYSRNDSARPLVQRRHKLLATGKKSATLTTMTQESKAPDTSENSIDKDKEKMPERSEKKQSPPPATKEGKDAPTQREKQSKRLQDAKKAKPKENSEDTPTVFENVNAPIRPFEEALPVRKIVTTKEFPTEGTGKAAVCIDETPTAYQKKPPEPDSSNPRSCYLPTLPAYK